MRNLFKTLAVLLFLVSAGWGATIELGSSSFVKCSFTGHSGSGTNRTHAIACKLNDNTPETCSLSFNVTGYTKDGHVDYYESNATQSYDKTSRTYTVQLKFDENATRKIEEISDDSSIVKVDVAEYVIEINGQDCWNKYNVSVTKTGEGKVTFEDRENEEQLQNQVKEGSWADIYAVPAEHYQVTEFSTDDKSLSYYSYSYDYGVLNYYFSMPAHDVSVSVTFEPISYSIAYDLGGGESEVVTNENPDSYSIENCDIDLKDPKRKGYTFTGWTDEYDDELTELTCGGMRNISLSANWKLEDFTISYDYESDNPTSYNMASETIELKDAKDRSGYEFGGWYDVNGQKVESIPAGSVGDVSLKARWNKINYGISYTLNGGKNNASNPLSYTVEDKVTLADASREGYKFEGWYNGDKKVSEIENGSTGAVALSAKWSPKPYSITYNFNGGSYAGEYETKFTIETESFDLIEPTKSGYTFAGWFDANGTKYSSVSKGTYKNLELAARWTVEGEYVIEYVLNGGTNASTNPGTYTVETETITFADPTRDGCTFDGWYNGDEKVSEIKKGSTGAVKLSAKWNLEQYSVTYDFNGGSYADAYETKFTVETEDFDLIVPSKAGYTFAGWFDVNGTKYSSISEGTFKNVALKASWVVEGEYVIEYVLDGGSNNDANPLTYTVETETFELAAASRLGYSFEGWVDGDGVLVRSIEKGTTGNLKVYAQWMVVEYVIVVKVNDEKMGSVTVGGEGPYYYNDEETLVASAKDGYQFVDWSDGVKNAERKITVVKDVELTANFEEKSSSSVKAEDGSSSSKESSSSSSDKVEDESSSSAKAESNSSSSYKTTSSSSAKAENKSSSSSKTTSSSSAKAEDKSSSSSKTTSSSSAKSDKDAIVAVSVPHFGLMVEDRDVMISGATVGAPVAVFDMQGRVVYAAKVVAPDFRITLPTAGRYLLRVGASVQKISIR